MLRITIPADTRELFDEEKNEFTYEIVSEEQTLDLEHSLVSLSKWESKWCKPFLSNKDKTDEEILDYIKCMTLTPNVDPDVYTRLTTQNYEDIHKYIAAPMTATTFSSDNNKKNNREVVTAEIVYYWMVALNIPFECQYWHFNKLLTLTRVCNIKNQPAKKTSAKERARRNASLNAARRKQFNSKG